MKCTTSREQLLEALTQADKSTGKNHTLPILACVLLEVFNETLSITATNLEVGICLSLPIADSGDGRIALSGSVLLHIISTLPSASSIQLSTIDGYLVVESVNGTSRIALQDEADFPSLPQVTDGVEVALPVKEFREALVSVAYCASASTIKPELASVFVHPHGSVLVTAATDSFRLAEKRYPLKQSVSTDPFLIPARSCGDLLRVLEKSKDTVTLTVSPHQLALTLPGVYMTLRLTHGTFPDYEAILPKTFVTEATLLAFDLERSLKKAGIFSDQFNKTTLTLAPKKKSFTIHAENSSVGETTDTLVATLTGDDLSINFNQRYLLDALQPITSDSVLLRFAGPSQSAIIQAVGDDSFRYLVMPMNR
jgi:DNA polymerase III subunit beta